MKLKRLAPGDYLSDDGRVRIERTVPPHDWCSSTRWRATVDATPLQWERTKQAAVAAAVRELARRDGRGRE